MPSKNATKEEVNTYFKIYREKNREQWNQYRREYNKEWRKKNGYHNEINSQLRYPEKVVARKKLNYAVKKGIILKEPCLVCGCMNSQAHHEIYSLPLEVVWLCSLHHMNLHRKLGVDKSALHA